MTLHATRQGSEITVHGNINAEVLIKDSRVQHIKITEHFQHVRSFWSQLGRLIEEADEEDRARQPAEEDRAPAP